MNLSSISNAWSKLLVSWTTDVSGVRKHLATIDSFHGHCCNIGETHQIGEYSIITYDHY